MRHIGIGQSQKDGRSKETVAHFGGGGGGENWGRIGYEMAHNVKGRNREEEDSGQGTGKI
jgi:hypothetical protein